MNAAQTITRRMVTGMGPRLTAPVRHSSTAMTPKDRKAMRMIFTTGTLATVSGVAFGAARSGNRVGTRYQKKNLSLDHSKWFLEGADVSRWLGPKH